jgi:methyl-accepting chemotaxis protein
MKNDILVTNQEVPMQKGQILVTRTDLKGKITYVNDTFLELLGYTREEMLGAEHSIIRHHDIPAEVYKDIYASLEDLKPWSGVLKGKTKSGNFFWFEANAIPLFKNGQVNEYLFVRYVPKPEQVEAAKQLYQKIADKKASIRSIGIQGVLKQIREIAIWKKMALTLTIFLLPLGLFMYRLFVVQDFILLAGVAGLTIVASGLLVGLALLIHKSLEHSVFILYSMANGQFRNKIDLNRKDQLGDFFRGIYSTQVKMNSQLTEAKQVGTDALRINRALDEVNSGVMVLSKDATIIYLNDAIKNMFNKVEPYFRKQLAQFDADKLLGQSLDLFQQPGLSLNVLKSIEDSLRLDLMIGNRFIHIHISPVIENSGIRVGYVAEWLDRTDEVSMEQEIENLVAKIKAGVLDSRIKIADQTGFLKTLGTGINQLTDVIESVFDDINRVMDSMAQGDLTSVINNEYRGVYDECKANINNTSEKLSEFIGQIRNAANFIDDSSQEISTGNKDLSQRVEQQAANLVETSSSMDEFTGTVTSTAENAHEANLVVTSAKQIAEKGGEVVNSAITAMQDINESSNKIAEIISVIDEIAFQTNLLALNASVEAARAGEQGRGFSVVATEVRNLAQRSANAAKQSSELIQSSVQKVRSGTMFVNETGLAFNEIIASIGKVGEIVSQIAVASSEQSKGIKLVNSALSELDEITQQNASLAQQAASASMALTELSTNMTHLVDFFTVKSTNNYMDIHQQVKSKAPDAVAKKQTVAVKNAPQQTQSKLSVSNSEWEEF